MQKSKLIKQTALYAELFAARTKKEAKTSMPFIPAVLGSMSMRVETQSKSANIYPLPRMYCLTRPGLRTGPLMKTEADIIQNII